MKEFYVFRHGETEMNRLRKWQGRGIDIKEWYDSCEQEISYDNIRRRSGLRIVGCEIMVLAEIAIHL